MDKSEKIKNIEKSNIDNTQQVKICGNILDYEIDKYGVKIIKKFNLTSVSL